MQNLYFLSDDTTGRLVIVQVTGKNTEKQIDCIAAKEGMPSPYSSNLTWGGVSSISINI